MAEIILLLGAESDALTIHSLYESRPGRGELFSDDLDESNSLRSLRLVSFGKQIPL